MRIRRRRMVFPVLLVIAALAVAACGGGGDDDAVDEDVEETPTATAVSAPDEVVEDAEAQATPDAEGEADVEPEVDVEAARTILATQGVSSATDEDIVYFAGVQAAFDRFGSAAAGARQDALEGGSTRNAFLQSLLDRGVGSAFIPVLEAMQALQPTTHYAADHATLVERVEQLVLIDAEIREAVVADDMASFLRHDSQLARTRADAALRLLPNLCRAVSRGVANCSTFEVNYESAYAVALRDASATLQGALVASRTAVNPADGSTLEALLETLRPEERAELIAALFGDLADEEEAAIASLKGLEPPSDFAADHARLIELIEGVTPIIRGIADEAATGELQSLRVDDERLLNAGRLRCDAIGGLSEEFREVALLIGPSADRDLSSLCASIGA